MRLFKILIVGREIDDIKTIFNIIVDSEEPFIIYRAASEELAFEIASSELPDLIVFLHDKSGFDGNGLMKKMNSLNDTINIPIIIYADAKVGSIGLDVENGLRDVKCLQRPIVKLELIKHIKEILSLSESRKTLKEKFGIINDDFAFVQVLVENMPHPIVYYDLNGIVQLCNQRFCDSIGKSRDVVQGYLVYDCFDESDSHYYQEQDLKLIDDHAVINFEYSINETEYMFSKSLVLGVNKEPQGIMCLLTDITEMKNAHNILLESKKRELVSNNLRLVQISELNSSLITEFSGLTEYTNDKGVEIIKRALSKFSLNTNENFWHEFDQRFLSVHESFYKKLNDLFPLLTPGEMKLCALLRLNLSSKDIAAITFQNSQSVDMARYRLRKKMALSSTENLVDFIINL